MEPYPTSEERNENVYFKDNAIFNIIFLSLTAIFVNFGNFLILAAFKNHHFVKNMDILIAFLALMDSIASLVVLPIAILTYAAPEITAGDVVVERVLCKISAVVFLFIQLSSSCVITLMTIDRFAAVKKPFFYRSYCEKRPKHIKIILTIFSVLLLALSVSVVLPENDPFTFRDGVCTFESRPTWIWGKLIIIIISLSQIPIVFCCYTAFVLTVRKLDRKRSSYFKRIHQQKQSTNGGCKVLVEQNRLGNRRLNSAVGQKTHVKCSSPMAKALSTSKDMYVNRGTRLSGTVALVVGIYYIPWILMLTSMIIELFTDDYYEVLHYVATRLVFMDSILNPFIYARMARYETAFREIACCPFRYCRCYTKPYPEGMTANEIHRIVNRLAFEEWESPGLNRRIYSKRKMMKTPPGGCYEDSFSELTGNSRMMIVSNSHIPNTGSSYEITHNATSAEGCVECKTNQEKRHLESQIIDEKSTRTVLRQESLSDGYLNSYQRQDDENGSLRNDNPCKLDSATSSVNILKSARSSSPDSLEIVIKRGQGSDEMPISNISNKLRPDCHLSHEDVNKSSLQENKPHEMSDNIEVSDVCECISETELNNVKTSQYKELKVNNANQQSTTRCFTPDCKYANSGEGYRISNKHLECKKAQRIQASQGGRFDQHHNATGHLKEKDNMTVLLRTRVANIEDSRKINFQLEVLDPSGLIEVHGSEKDKNMAVQDSAGPNFVFSLKENRFIADESSRSRQKIKRLKINYTLKRLSGVDQVDNKGVVKLHEPIFRDEILDEDASINESLRTAPVNDFDYITPF